MRLGVVVVVGVVIDVVVGRGVVGSGAATSGLVVGVVVIRSSAVGKLSSWSNSRRGMASSRPWSVPQIFLKDQKPVNIYMSISTCV